MENDIAENEYQKIKSNPLVIVQASDGHISVVVTLADYTLVNFTEKLEQKDRKLSLLITIE